MSASCRLLFTGGASFSVTATMVKQLHTTTGFNAKHLRTKVQYYSKAQRSFSVGYISRLQLFGTVYWSSCSAWAFAPLNVHKPSLFQSDSWKIPSLCVFTRCCSNISFQIMCTCSSERILEFNTQSLSQLTATGSLACIYFSKCTRT